MWEFAIIASSKQQLINYALDTLIYDNDCAHMARAPMKLTWHDLLWIYLFFPSSLLNYIATPRIVIIIHIIAIGGGSVLILERSVNMKSAYIFVCHCLFLMYQLTSNVCEWLKWCRWKAFWDARAHGNDYKNEWMSEREASYVHW